MRVGELVSFNDEDFFEGAVQLSWVYKNPAKAREAASAFVFHGPRYHGADDAAQEGLEEQHRLKDSASVVNDLVESILAGRRGEERNPFWLAVAGYGSGKSHLASAIATLLEDPRASSAQQVVANVARADEQIGSALSTGVEQLNKPALVICLDGMAGFHLGDALTQAVYTRLDQHGVDAGAIRDLSPRFQIAEQFVERNYAIRQEAFAQRLPGMDATAICERLRRNDEQTYAEVDALYTEANGSPIPVTGQESVQDLLQALCDIYCDSDGPFSSVVILFDELGRYLEYAAEKPHLAGDAALQQLFQGVQDNPDKLRFVGFIQYELKAYLRRFSSNNMQQLLRYITRFDSAEKIYLSTNLETIFAHIIGKNEDALSDVWQRSRADELSKASWQRLDSTLPNISRYPVWHQEERFNQVIARGCWPLHPLATWFLTRQSDVVQSRSAMTFIKETLEEISSEQALQDGRLRQVSAAELLLNRLLPEVLAAEQHTGSNVAENLQLLLEKLRGHLNIEEKLTLAGVAILEKIRLGKQSLETVDQLLCEATALPRTQLKSALQRLSSELGALEWNEDLGQYELISDATTRGQFQQWLRQRLSDASCDAIANLFQARGLAECGLGDIETDFAAKNDINTPDWRFQATPATAGSLSTSLDNAFKAWQSAESPRDAKGQVIYLYIHPDDDLPAIDQQINDLFDAHLNKANCAAAPIWVIGIFDSSGNIAEHLWRIHVFDERLSSEERERFRRFIPEERERSTQSLTERVKETIKERRYWIAGMADVPQSRLKAVGEAIFKHVYPEVLPFPFDGFASSSGGGAADAMQLTRNLITRQVDGAWLQAQPKRLQNRVKALLVNNWQALKSSGELSEPQEPQIKKVFEELKQAHSDDPQRSLWQSYQLLIGPPYGMNASSAAVLLGLLIAGSHPPRRIEQNGKPVTAGDWVNAASPKQQSKHFLQQEILKQSSLRFLAEDAESRWRSLLSNWENEQNLQKLVEYQKHAAQMQQEEPIPEAMEGLYGYLRDRSQAALEKLNTRQRELDEWEEGLERATRQNNVAEMLRIGSKLLRSKRNMEDSPEWDNHPFISTCENLLAYARSIIGEHIGDWIFKQSCHNAAEVSNFRHKMEKAVKSLKELGFQHEAETLEKQVQHITYRIEQRQAFQLTLDESDDYPRQPDPNPSTPVKELRDQIRRGDDLINAVKQASNALQKQEIDSRVNAIWQRQDKLRRALEEQEQQLAELFSLQIDCEADLREALSKAESLRDLFAQTKDYDDIQEAVLQLSRIVEDLATWEHGDISPERLEELLNQQIPAQAKQLTDELQDKEIDPVWDLHSIYQTLAQERVNAAYRRSYEWVNPRLDLIDSIEQRDYQACHSLEQELLAAPSYLAREDRTHVANLLVAVRKRRAELAEQQRAQHVAEWLSQLPQENEIKSFDLRQAEELLRQLESPPEQLNNQEYNQLKPLKEAATARYDELSIEDIIRRIMRLSEERRKELLARLSH
ncbi:hypothetical protein HH1059_13340 [Halorhodospira halochloris]|uniref:Uncharacterized protein n=1 Tax=Halorhodospira halochloris TaxID=1052 RepID=A0A110B5L9_HALHR|nr:hypothetical protein [Halorhodospira halochloris]MBK1652120.1 hypothetical protein [Halorhodospira halochloris]BAU58043.1 hypothetical protein HH1059_13340 [Halorhodospira halochloris]